tara:strand:- start:771 stop:890 length:120 start_codon:yes stop_codon:yes gene_type:complete
MAKEEIIYFEKTLIDHSDKEDSPDKSPLKLDEAEGCEED